MMYERLYVIALALGELPLRKHLLLSFNIKPFYFTKILRAFCFQGSAVCSVLEYRPGSQTNSGPFLITTNTLHPICSSSE